MDGLWAQRASLGCTHRVCDRLQLYQFSQNDLKYSDLKGIDRKYVVTKPKYTQELKEKSGSD